MGGIAMVSGPALTGALMCIAGGIVDNTGVTIMKLSHLRCRAANQYNEEYDAGDQVQTTIAYYWNPLWQLGFIMYLSGSCLNAIGLSFAPESVVASLGSFVLVTNSFNAYCILNEQMTRTIVLGVAIIIQGSLLAVFTAGKAPRYTIATLNQLFTRPIAYCFASFVLLLITLLLWHLEKQGIAILNVEFRRRSDQIQGDPLLEHHIAAESASPIILSRLGIFINQRHLTGIQLAMLAAIIGSCTVQSAKATSVLIRYSISEHQFRIPILPLAIFTLFCGMCQIHVLNLALRSCDQLLVVPSFAVTLEFFVITGGLFFYNEIASFDTWQCIVFPLGIVISFSGVGVVTYALWLRNQRNEIMGQDNNFEIAMSLNPNSGPSLE